MTSSTEIGTTRCIPDGTEILHRLFRYDPLKLAERGGKNAKKRAVVATARKLAVLLHLLWSRGEVYDPLHGVEPAPTSA